MGAVSRTFRLLLAADAKEGVDLRLLFVSGALEGWEVLEAATFEQAHFILQYTECDVVLVDESLYLREKAEALRWLIQDAGARVVLLADLSPQALTLAFQQGPSQWLPRQLALDHPQLLAAALTQAARIGEFGLGKRKTVAALRECQRQQDLLVNLLWRTMPRDVQGGWLTPRYLLERLEEETARSQRHGLPLTVAVGEVQLPASTESSAGVPELSDWMARQICRVKRRSDVGGPYGPHGFLLLLVQTPPAGGDVCCRRLRNFLEQGEHRPHGLRGPLRAYFGLASFSVASATPKSLLCVAEEHLQQAREVAGGEVLGDTDTFP
jgi:hypothetical protein